MSGKLIVGGLLVVIVVALASPVAGLLAFGALLLAVVLRPQAPAGRKVSDGEEPGRVGDLERRAAHPRGRGIAASLDRGRRSRGRCPVRPQPPQPAPRSPALRATCRRPLPSRLPACHPAPARPGRRAPA